jgi:hypothetical protein
MIAITVLVDIIAQGVAVVVGLAFVLRLIVLDDCPLCGTYHDGGLRTGSMALEVCLTRQADGEFE